MKKLVAAIDAGTGGVRCVVYDAVGNCIASHYCETDTLYTANGHAEQDPNELAACAFEAVRCAVIKAAIDPSAIVGISFSGTQTTFTPVGQDGNYLSGMILWQDMRGAEMFPWIEKRLTDNRLTEANLYDLTLRPIDTIAQGPKLFWLRRHHPDIYRRIYTLANPQSILQCAFGAEKHTVDPSDTGWWCAHNSLSMEPDPTLLDIFDLDARMFPEICPTGKIVGTVSPVAALKTGLKAGTPLFQGAVDQCCAALAAGNYGTDTIATLCMGTAGVIMNYSEEPVPDPMHRYYVLHYPTGGYASEFAVPVAAAAFRWVRDMLYPADMFSHDGIYSLMDSEAAGSPIGCNGLVFLPGMSGRIYPVMDTASRGGYIGISMGTCRADLIRSALEGICYEIRSILEARSYPFRILRLLGGGARSEFWNQMQADVYGCPVETIETEEASALGAAMIAAYGAGLYPDLKSAVKAMSRIKKRYEPDPAHMESYTQYYNAWTKCVEDLSLRTFPALQALRNR